MKINNKIKEELEWWEYAEKVNAHLRKFKVVQERIKTLKILLKNENK